MKKIALALFMACGMSAFAAESPNLTVVDANNAASITDSTGVVWTLDSSGRTYENGVADGGENVATMVYDSGSVNVFVPYWGGQWFIHTSSGWAQYTASTLQAGSGFPASQIANDGFAVNAANEGYPEGMPVGWSQRTASYEQDWPIPTGRNALLQWAEVYVGPNGMTSTNSQVDVYGAQLFILNGSTWTTVNTPATQINGEYDSEDWSNYLGSQSPGLPGDGSWTVPMKTGTTACNGGSGDQTKDCLYHWYSANRTGISWSSVTGIVSCEIAKLTLINPNGTDDRASADLLMEVGVDSYVATNDSENAPIPAVGGGRYKYVTTAPRSFCATTMTAAQLAANPPPISLTGVNP